MHRAVDGAEFDVVSQAATRHFQRSAEQRNVLGSVPARRDDFAAAARDLVADRGSAARHDHGAAGDVRGEGVRIGAQVGAAQRPARADHDFATAGNNCAVHHPAARNHFNAAAVDLGGVRHAAARYGNKAAAVDRDVAGGAQHDFLAAAADGRRGRQDRAVNSEATVGVFVQPALQDDQRAAAADCGTANHSAGGHLHRPPVQYGRSARHAGHNRKAAAENGGAHGTAASEEAAATGYDLLAAAADHRAAGEATDGNDLLAAIEHRCAARGSATVDDFLTAAEERRADGDAAGGDDDHTAAADRRVAGHALAQVVIAEAETANDLHAAVQDRGTAGGARRQDEHATAGDRCVDGGASRQDERSTATHRGAGDRAAAVDGVVDIEGAATADGRADGAAKRVDVDGDAVADGVTVQYVADLNGATVQQVVTCFSVVIVADHERAAARNRECNRAVRSVQGQGSAAEDRDAGGPAAQHFLAAGADRGIAGDSARVDQLQTAGDQRRVAGDRPAVQFKQAADDRGVDGGAADEHSKVAADDRRVAGDAAAPKLKRAAADHRVAGGAAAEHLQKAGEGFVAGGRDRRVDGDAAVANLFYVINERIARHAGNPQQARGHYGIDGDPAGVHPDSSKIDDFGADERAARVDNRRPEPAAYGQAADQISVVLPV